MDKVKERTGIYHEHQQGALCAQHALNNLLQSSMFSPDTLADIARDLDVEEQNVLTHTQYQSENMDDTGFFSIQVLQQGLKAFDIELVPFRSQEPIAQQARNAPQSIQAYICNLGAHWFTIRRFGRQYFDLNSIYYVPKLIQTGVLQIFLNMIQDNGYSVFIVHGNLPSCVADEQLLHNPISEGEYELLIRDLPKLMIDDKAIGNMHGLHDTNGKELLVQVPMHIYKEFEKNPNNPQIKRLLQAKLPKSITEQIYTDVGDSGPTKPRSRAQVRVTLVPDNMPLEQFTDSCGRPNCLTCRPQLQKSSEHNKKQLIDRPMINNSIEDNREPVGIARRMTHVMIATVRSDNPNEPPQQQIVGVRDLLVIEKPSNTNQRSMIDDQWKELKKQQVEMQKKRRELQQKCLEIENNCLDMEKNRREIEKTCLEYEKSRHEMEEQLRLLQDISTQSAFGTSDMDDDADVDFFEQQIEKEYQRSLDKAIAASLAEASLTAEQTKDTPEIIPLTYMNPPSTPTTDSEPVTNKTPISLTTIFSSPSTDTHVSSLTNTYSSHSTDTPVPVETNTYPSVPINMSSPSLPVDTSSIPPINASLPQTTTTTDSYSPKLTDSDFAPSPSIEELRQRRLRNNNNRDRSIICSPSNYDD